ncbi:hypothetical protein [Actinomadura rudentiformis]|uniref:Uncharacterized protein n=1 Tax=Actinomadura rudentiformis TaxID=359158 RepID=A0A6H9YXG5_9ACTN|nr:hypothetical protein [Actinomadura rudentiformis]KAB2347294.1 hypothetical protein F8566_19980 [Actinomadura rudentiformis]
MNYDHHRAHVAEVAERFAKEAGGHQMTVLHDDGHYRHLRFKPAAGHSFYWFDLVTIPHALIFRGDGTSFVFSRIEDMFAFFRGSSHNGGINATYWAEKLTSDRDSVMTYDADLFELTVKEHAVQAIRDREAPRGIGRAIKRMLEEGDTGHEEGARDELNAFAYAVHRASCSCGDAAEFNDDLDAWAWSRHHVKEQQGQHNVSVKCLAEFRFAETWEWDLRSFDWWFLWACHAIVWGIGRYDAALRELAAQKATQPVTSQAGGAA